MLRRTLLRPSGTGPLAVNVVRAPLAIFVLHVGNMKFYTKTKIECTYNHMFVFISCVIQMLVIRDKLYLELQFKPKVRLSVFKIIFSRLISNVIGVFLNKSHQSYVNWTVHHLDS